MHGCHFQNLIRMVNRMDDLISRRETYEALTAYYHQTTDVQHDALREALDRVPSVDAVKVIRCEQCMHYNNIDFHCYYHGSMCFKPNDYCPYGRVRADG